jgi:hypothetical protein
MLISVLWYKQISFCRTNANHRLQYDHIPVVERLQFGFCIFVGLLVKTSPQGIDTSTNSNLALRFHQARVHIAQRNVDEEGVDLRSRCTLFFSASSTYLYRR